MKMGSTQRLAFSVILGFAVIFNLIGSSYLEFYPTTLLIGVAFATGIVMVVGSAYFMIRFPERLVAKRKQAGPMKVHRPVAVARRAAVPC